MLILGGALITWQSFAAPPAAPILAVFDVPQPPEPPSERPPEHEPAPREEPLPRAETPKVQLPQVQLPSLNPLPVPQPQERPAPAPPVEHAVPERQPAPPAARQSNAKPSWEGMVLAALNRVRRYPREASLRRQQGVPYIRFVMDREGRVLSSRLERSSGFSALDDEAVGLPRRAAPLPVPPEDVPGATIELVVPVEFFMRGR